MGKLQLDMFAAEEAELLPVGPVVFRPDADRVRRRLARILDEARGADAMPWDTTQLALYEKVIPQMSLALPEDEAARFKLDFARELERLG
jgi:hypothetical protein